MKVSLLVLCLVVIQAIFPLIALADGTPSGGYDRLGNTVTVSVKVTTKPDGAYVEITVHQSVPGTTSPAPPAEPTPLEVTRTDPAPVAHADPPTPPPTVQNRFWSDPTGVYEQT